MIKKTNYRWVIEFSFNSPWKFYASFTTRKQARKRIRNYREFLTKYRIVKYASTKTDYYD